MAKDLPSDSIGDTPAQRPSQWSAWLVLGCSLTITFVVWQFDLWGFEAREDAVHSLLLLLTGFLICLLLFGLVWMLGRARQWVIQTEQATSKLEKSEERWSFALGRARLWAIQMAEVASKLQKSEERWNFALEGAGDGVWDWNVQTGQTLYSKRWKEMLGYAEHEIENNFDEWENRIHPDDVALTLANLQALLDGETATVAQEFRMSCKDGSWKWILGRGMVTSRDDTGKALRVVGTNTDITERKQDEIIQDALLEAQTDAGVGLFAVKHGRIVSTNAAVVAITGYSSEEIKALSDFAPLVHPDDRDRVMCIHLLRLAGERCSTRYEFSILTKTGERREVEVSVTIMPYAEVFQVLGIIIDITERKQLSARLQQSHDLLAKISAHVPGLIFQLRLFPDGRATIPFISDSVKELYGLTPEEVRADASLLSAFGHPDDVANIAGSFLESAQSLLPWHHEYRIITPKKEVRWRLGDAKAEKLEDDSILWHGFITDTTERKQAEEALLASNERFRSLTHLGADWFWEQDENFRFTEMSGGNLSPQSSSVMESIGKTRWDLDFADMDKSVWQAHQAQLERHEPFQNFETRYRDSKGAVHVISISGEPVFDKAGRFAGYRGVGTEITERKRAEEELQLAALVYQNSSEAMSVSAPDGTILTINPAFTKITGYTAEEAIGQDTRIFNSDHLDQVPYEEILQVVNTTGHWQGELWSRRKNNEIYPASITINTIFNTDGTPYRHVSLFSDITNRKQTEELIWKQANFDALTQLPNRSMFHDRVAQEIKKVHRAGQQLALLFIDLDHFKEINDTLGHDTGDNLLVEAARRICACVRETDAVARLGGDEFTVLLCGIEEGEVGIVERIAQSILDNLSTPFALGNEEVYVSASIGITMYPDDADDIEGLFKNADQAMYLSKSQGRNRYSYFTPALQQAAQVRLRMINDLRGALAGHQFRVYFQPIMELATGRIVKAEALVRWHHPQRGVVLPGEFISLAEETGLIHEIGDWVFREAARWGKRWQTNSNRTFQISVNKSPVQFHRDATGLVEWFAHLRSLGLPGHCIAIEITEGLLLNADPVIFEALLSCRDAGIQVAIDDFGTGYSSLAYLKKFNIDYLKIDQSFIRNLSPCSSDMALSEAIIVMAHKLGLKVIAEGVETSVQRDLLASVRCDLCARLSVCPANAA